MTLGREVLGPEIPLPDVAPPSRQEHVALQSLWQARWPAIALQACIDQIQAAEPTERRQVARDLPCETCDARTRCLNAKKKELGPLLYDREILTKPRSQESTLFPFELFRPMLNTKLSQVDHYQKPEHDADNLIVVSGWDLAWSEKVGNDRLVRTTAVMDLRRRKKRLLNIRRYPAGLRYTQQCELIKAEHRRFNEDLVVIESDAAQIIWAQNLEETSDVPVYRHTAGDKQHLQIGVPGLLIDFDNCRWEFPYAKDSFQLGEMENLLSEFEAFGWVDGKLEGVGEHDDEVMSFWHCSHGLKLMSGTLDEFRSGLQEGRTD